MGRTKQTQRKVPKPRRYPLCVEPIPPLMDSQGLIVLGGFLGSGANGTTDNQSSLSSAPSHSVLGNYMIDHNDDVDGDKSSMSKTRQH